MGWRDTQMLTPESVGRHSPYFSGIRARDMGAVMSWALGGMALLMGASGLGLILYYYWDVMPGMLRLGSLGGLLLMQWVCYCLFARFGWSSREVTSLLLCLSCLLLCLILAEVVPGMELWLQGLLLLGGIVLVTAVKPSRTAVGLLALACMGELGLLWLDMHNNDSVSDWGLLWTSVLTVLMMWGIAGGWCYVTPRRGYAAFGPLGPISFALYLLLYQGMLLYPQHLRPAELQGQHSLQDWGLMMSIWMLPMLFLLYLQRCRARRFNRPFFSYSFILYFVATLTSLPIGLLLMERNVPEVGAIVIFGYAACIVYYGAEFRLPFFVLLGCALAFLTAIGIPVGLGADHLWSGLIMLVLGMIFLYSSLMLSRRRDNLLQGAALRRAGAFIAGPPSPQHPHQEPTAMPIPADPAETPAAVPGDASEVHELIPHASFRLPRAGAAPAAPPVVPAAPVTLLPPTRRQRHPEVRRSAPSGTSSYRTAFSTSAASVAQALETAARLNAQTARAQTVPMQGSPPTARGSANGTTAAPRPPRRVPQIPPLPTSTGTDIAPPPVTPTIPLGK